MERNAWEVAKEVAERINHEPGPAGDFMQSFLTPKLDSQFFFNTQQLRQFVSSSVARQNDVPGSAYFKKITVFIQEHMEVGELYLEYIKGNCQEIKGNMCEFCTKFPPSVECLKRVPRPMPDESALPDLCYLPYDKTPTVKTSGSPRDVDDYQPRAQTRKKFEEGTLSLDDAESIAKFSETYAVKETAIRKYLEHLDYLKMKKLKRTEDRRRKKLEDRNKLYSDFSWIEMFHKGTLAKLTVPVLDIFLDYHNLANSKKMTKKEKLQVIVAWIANSEIKDMDHNVDHEDDDADDYGDDNQDNETENDSSTEELSSSDFEDEDIVLQEVGQSSSESELECEESSLARNSRSGRPFTTYLSRHFYGDSD